MEWQENDLSQVNGFQIGGMTVESEEDSQEIQLKKFQDPSKDEYRQVCLALVERFGILFSSGNVQEIATELLTEDCETFIFYSTRKKSGQYAIGPQGFIDLYKSRQIQKRVVRETHVDVEKYTVCQVSYNRIIYEGESDSVDEVACEIFSIRDGKISKLRSSYGCLRLNNNEFEDPLEPKRKDIMLAKVKELNFALAGQPDLEKLVLLFDENTEYKVWRWNDSKCFTLKKNNLISLFQELEENMSIKCIIPYELSTDTEAQYVTANYVYHLQENSSGKKFYWLSTCIYSFDNNINITKIIQQGELHPEGEVDIPFQVYSRGRLESIIRSIYSGDLSKLDSFYADTILYDCSLWAIFSPDAPNGGYVKGLKNIEHLLKIKETLKDVEMKVAEIIDVYVDYCDESYDVLIFLTAFEGTKPSEKDPGKREAFSGIELSRMSFENGKLANLVQFISKIDAAIPSPFDDKNFRYLNMQ